MLSHADTLSLVSVLADEAVESLRLRVGAPALVLQVLLLQRCP